MKLFKSTFLIPLFLLAFISISFAESNEEKIEFGKNLMKMRDYVKAIKKFDEVLENDKNHPDALFNKSLCNYNLFEYKLALDDLNKLVKIVPTISDVYNLRGLTLMALKDTSKAFNDFDKAINLDKKFAAAYLNRSKAFIYFNKNQEAINDLNKCIALDSNIAESYYTKARAEHNLGLYKSAVDDFTNAMKCSYVNNDIYYRRGNSYFKDKDYINAINDYTQVIYYEPLNPLAYNNRAFAYDALGDSLYAKQDRQMLADIQLGLSLDPSTVKFEKFANKDSNFTILIPEEFLMKEENTKDSIVVDFNIKNSAQRINKIEMRLVIHPFYSQKNNFKEPAEVIEAWRMKQDSLGTGFWRYQLSERVNKPYRTFPTLLDKILVQKDLKGIAAIKWNYGIAYGEHLIEMHFDIPLPLYPYYQELFLKSIESFNILKI